MVPRLKSIICGFDTLTMIHVVALSDLTSFFRDYDMVDCKTDQRFLDLFGHSFRCKDTKKRTVIAGSPLLGFNTLIIMIIISYTILSDIPLLGVVQQSS